ncbi:hypothetical protein BKA70DRAFT_1373969 [Coprinopsis sp. MPI-PUGE-AT-0042]|nr:hypothetical protein BKA70DRAFT_1373969 [Coprinopsis sp. MPI-PUGE-AT-0042]
MGSDGLKKEILVVGFGAVGLSWTRRVSVVARSNYEVVNREGLHIKSGKYVYKSIADAATQVGGKGFDYVVVATKAIPELTTTPQLLEPLLSRPYIDQYSQPVYVLLQNGLGVEKDLYEAIRAFGQTPKIASAAVWIGTNLVSAGVVDTDRVTIGMYRHQDRTTTTNSPEEQSILDDIGGMLGDGGSQVTSVPEIQRMKFAKNFWNVIFLQYTPSNVPTPPPSDTPNAYAPYRAAVSGGHPKPHNTSLKAVFEELMVLGRALGYPDTPDALPSSLPESILNGTMSIHEKPDSSHKPSMMLDMERGSLWKLRMAQEVGVGVPRVEMMYALLLVVQNQILRVRQNS